MKLIGEFLLMFSAAAAYLLLFGPKEFSTMSLGEFIINVIPAVIIAYGIRFALNKWWFKKSVL